MNGSQSLSSSSYNSASISVPDQDVEPSRRNTNSTYALSFEQSRHWRDVFWLAVFIVHLGGLGLLLVVLGLNRFKKNDRLNIDKYTGFLEHHRGLTEYYWPLYAVAAGAGTFLGWTWLLLLGYQAIHMMKVSVHILTTYLAVVSVFCFWAQQFFWGVTFAIGAVLQFLYVISVIDRLPFSMLVLQKAVKMAWSLPRVMCIAYAFILVMLSWMALWSFGAAGVVASSIGDSGRWWLLVVFSISLFWTGAVLCNTVHVIVSGMVFLVLFHGGQETASMPSNSLMKSLRYAVTTSFGSICYGSLFTAAVRTLRWEIRGFRAKIGNNECLLCCVDFVFHIVETLVRFFNKYAYVQIAVSGKSFNHSARDAWELFQSTGVEALIAYDCSGAVLLMGTILGGLIAGTCAGVWTWLRSSDRVLMVGSTSMLMGMVLVGLAMVVVEGAVTSLYICYALDPLLIHRWDPEFFNQMSEMLHQRLQHRSARGRQVLTHNTLDSHIPS
ncbi:CTL-like protein DDB_G0274487 isoform X1 [Chenopodium quinoa]|uniref:CTL-like protein DDB_G0274487 isoform X1 n=1 Tax=Chenopodium quinoa TaxID=63459 RepID=UPI000B7804AF|nr:CTL-like protein DDB_G0274487 isoform X1 [Chenopodium quinoa]